MNKRIKAFYEKNKDLIVGTTMIVGSVSVVVVTAYKFGEYAGTPVELYTYGPEGKTHNEAKIVSRNGSVKTFKKPKTES